MSVRWFERYAVFTDDAFCQLIGWWVKEFAYENCSKKVS